MFRFRSAVGDDHTGELEGPQYCTPEEFLHVGSGASVIV
jgi:hypothetical protein